MCNGRHWLGLGLMFGVSMTLRLRPVMLGVIRLNPGVLCSFLLCGDSTRKNEKCGCLRASERLVCDVAELSVNVTRWFTWVSWARKLLTECVLCLFGGSAGLVRFCTVVIRVRHGVSS